MRADTALKPARKYSRFVRIRAELRTKFALSRSRPGHSRQDGNNDAERNNCRIFAVSFDTIAAVPGNQPGGSKSLNLDGAFGQAPQERNP